MPAKEVIKLRDKLQVSQEELSDAFGLSGRNAISRWETGRRKPAELARRLLCLLNDLPVGEAKAIIKRLGQYKLKKR